MLIDSQAYFALTLSLSKILSGWIWRPLRSVETSRRGRPLPCARRSVPQRSIMASRSPVDRHAPPSSVGDLKLEILEIPLRALSSFRRLNPTSKRAFRSISPARGCSPFALGRLLETTLTCCRRFPLPIFEESISLSLPPLPDSPLALSPLSHYIRPSWHLQVPLIELGLDQTGRRGKDSSLL